MRGENGEGDVWFSFFQLIERDRDWEEKETVLVFESYRGN